MKMEPPQIGFLLLSLSLSLSLSLWLWCGCGVVVVWLLRGWCVVWLLCGCCVAAVLCVVCCVVLLSCVVCVESCFTVSLIFTACDGTTKLVPDAPSPRRILAQNKLLKKLNTPQQTQPPPRWRRPPRTLARSLCTVPHTHVKSARCCSRSLFSLLHTRRVHHKTRSSVPSATWEALPTLSSTRSRASP